MARTQSILSRFELESLRRLAGGVGLALSSTQRVRLEFLGLIVEGPSGIALTAEGRRRAATDTDADCAAPDPGPPVLPRKTDALGRSRRRRRSPFD